MSQQLTIKTDPAEAKPVKAKEPRPPCQRDREIYHAVRICHRKQTPVAEQFGMSQGRVSQIVREVAKYMSGFFPGEDLDVRLSQMPVTQLVDWECYQRRLEDHRRAELVFEQSQQKLVTEQRTYGGKSLEEQLEKTVITEREQRISLDAVKVLERINDKIERTAGSGKASGVREHPDSVAGRKGRPPHREADASRSPIPPPECLTPEDRERWPQLMREEQELAAGRLEYYPNIPLDRARVPEGPLWSYYPWRTEAESSSATLAGQVVDGTSTIEGYFRNLQHLEVSKPLGYPNVLTKDREGRWQLLDPQQVPLPVMPPERAALPERSPEQVYWPYKSKAEHYAMMLAEMVLRGHLSRDQYEGLSAWASWYTNEKYPDPLARIDRVINAEEAGGGTGTLPVQDVPDEARPAGQVTNATYGSEVAPGQDDAQAGERPRTPGDDEGRSGHPPLANQHWQDASGTQPTRLERRLASGRRMSPVERRRLEGLVARRREAGGD
jgi:hypothetical protein